MSGAAARLAERPENGLHELKKRRALIARTIFFIEKNARRAQKVLVFEQKMHPATGGQILSVDPEIFHPPPGFVKRLHKKPLPPREQEAGRQGGGLAGSGLAGLAGLAGLLGWLGWRAGWVGWAGWADG